MKFVVINGPNINFLGIREPEIYGSDTYASLLELIAKHARERGVEVDFFQSNHEGAIVDRVQQAYFEKADGIIINPAAYTHTSVAILDALKAVSIPTVEVHISKVSDREKFRQISYVSKVAIKTIEGRGFCGCVDAMDFLIEYLKGKENE